MTITRKKLIEVALPLDAINKASAREKSIRHGHPSTLHLWWARRPLAAARAVIFAQMVDDPSSCPDLFPTEKAQEKERLRLFKIVEDLVQWENTTNETVLQAARDEIWQSWRRACADNADHPRAKEIFDRHKLPAFHDPFAGGGSLPLEAQRLGLEAYASDLNPVAVLINKAMIEIPPKFAGIPPVNPEARADMKTKLREWRGAQGLAEDVRYYGKWMRDEAEKRIGHLYPKVEITPEMAKDRPDLEPYVGRELTVIAWLWARTVKSPNPAFAHVDVPLVSNFMLSTKKGKEAYVEPVVEDGGYRFTVKAGIPKDASKSKCGTKSGGSGSNFFCLMSGIPMTFEYLRAEAKVGRMGARLMAVVAEGDRGRVYLSPTVTMEKIALSVKSKDTPETELPAKALGFRVQEYGMTKWRDLFTSRQLVALTTFSDLVQEAREQVKRDALAASYSSPQRGEVGRGAEEWTPHPSPPPLGEGECKEGFSSHLGNVMSEENSSPQLGVAGKGAEWRPTPIPRPLLQAARNLRSNMTDAEQLLWQCLRSKQLDGFKFRRQHPIGRFILDFYCPSRKLAIELDGGQHNYEDMKSLDIERTSHLNSMGIKVIRFWNNEVLENIEGVLHRIWEELNLEGPLPSPPPLGEGDEDVALEDGGVGAQAYADAVAVYLGFALEKLAECHSTICTWSASPKNELVVSTFRRHAIPMTWDFAEANKFAESSGSINKIIGAIENVILMAIPASSCGWATQDDATKQITTNDKVVSTDPPYFDNIGYADLSDFFYVWLRQTLKGVLPGHFLTLAVPKTEELVATPYRHSNKEQAEAFFLSGMTLSMSRLADQIHDSFPVTIYYAFKQAEDNNGDGFSNTGWDTFLEAVIRAGLAITGTWPIRTERGGRSIGIGTNALASSIVLVCRKRPDDAPTATRREFLNALKSELPKALIHLQRGNIAPVDLAQAAIGPGMAVYTRYAKVLDAEGKALTVREALALINQTLDETLAEQEGDFDADSRWALAWFEQMGFAEGEFGVAETLSKAKVTSVEGMRQAGILVTGRGKVRLLRPEELPAGWDPETDTRLTAWETVHHLIQVLAQGGEEAAAGIVKKLGGKAETARELCYRLYMLCERKKRAAEALAYNSLVQSWPEITRLAREGEGAETTGQGGLFNRDGGN